MAVEAGAGDDAEGAGGDAVRAAVADVGLDVDVLELVVQDGPRRARLLARGGDAVLADVAHHEPAVFLGRAGDEVQRDPRATVLWPGLRTGPRGPTVGLPCCVTGRPSVRRCGRVRRPGHNTWRPGHNTGAGLLAVGRR